MQRLILFIKGVLMGLADVVPGVSGGTIAFALGIYPAFMAALASVNVRWIWFFILYILSGFKREYLEKSKEYFWAIHWRFLLTLLSGMVSALLMGAAFVPGLMADYPSQMRAFFFGLVLASITVPFAALTTKNARMFLWMFVSAAGIFFVLGAHGAPPQRWVDVITTQDMTLKDVTRTYPGLSTPQSLYCDTVHNDLRLGGAASSGHGLERDVVCAPSSTLSSHHATALDALVVPAHTTVRIAQPTFLFTFFAGALAICAMVLPGISGSFILLILGAYSFVFSSVHATQMWVMGRGAHALSALYVGVFVLGVVVGVMLFSRVVTYFFEHHKDTTLAVLIGVMIGSMRVLWPFQTGSVADGNARNILPLNEDPVWLCLGLAIAGFALVIGLARLSARLEQRVGSV